MKTIDSKRTNDITKIIFEIENRLLALAVLSSTVREREDFPLLYQPGYTFVHVILKQNSKLKYPLRKGLLETFPQTGTSFSVEDALKIDLYCEDLQSSNKDESELIETYEYYLERWNSVHGKYRAHLLIEKAVELSRKGKIEEAVLSIKLITLEDPIAIESTFSLVSTLLDSDSNFRVGLSELDDVGGLMKQNLMTIAADTGSQKTTLTIWLMIQILINNPTYTAVFFSKEMASREIALKITTYFTDITVDEIMQSKSILNPTEEKAYRQGLYFRISQEVESNAQFKDIMNRFKIISPNQFDTAEDMVRIIDKYKPDIWALDFFTLLSDTKSTGTDQSYGEHAQILKQACVSYNCLGIVLAQLKHNTVDSETRMSKIPNKGDIEYGKQLNQLSSWVFVIFLPGKYYSDKALEGYPNNMIFLLSKKVRYGGSIEIGLLANFQTNKYTKLGASSQYIMDYLNKYKSKPGR